MPDRIMVRPLSTGEIAKRFAQSPWAEAIYSAGILLAGDRVN
jgi:hypothetical protein